MSETLTLLSARRQKLMGIAILMVLLYHLYCWFSKATPYLAVFSTGYFGVDIFLLLSGFGLCFSFEKNSLGKFYWRRFIRLVPLYWLVLVLAFIIKAESPGGFDWKGLLEGMSTVSYWKYSSIDWYIPAIIFLYAIFPILFHATKKFGAAVLAIFCATALASSHYLNLHWSIDCLVSRIPVFIFGILAYLGLKDGKSLKPAFIIMLLTFAFAVSFNESRFLLASSICPCIVFVLLNVLPEGKPNGILVKCGNLSFELYLADMLKAVFLERIHFNDIIARDWGALPSSALLIVIYLGILLLSFGVIYLISRFLNKILQNAL